MLRRMLGLGGNDSRRPGPQEQPEEYKTPSDDQVVAASAPVAVAPSETQVLSTPASVTLLTRDQSNDGDSGHVVLCVQRLTTDSGEAMRRCSGLEPTSVGTFVTAASLGVASGPARANESTDSSWATDSHTAPITSAQADMLEAHLEESKRGVDDGSYQYGLYTSGPQSVRLVGRVYPSILEATRGGLQSAARQRRSTGNAPTEDLFGIDVYHNESHPAEEDVRVSARNCVSHAVDPLVMIGVFSSREQAQSVTPRDVRLAASRSGNFTHRRVRSEPNLSASKTEESSHRPQ